MLLKFDEFIQKVCCIKIILSYMYIPPVRSPPFGRTRNLGFVESR